MATHEPNPPAPEWDPRSAAVVRDQVAAYDEMRRRNALAYSEYLHWSVFGHDEVVRILDDPDTFSNEVSAHLSVPNGMDPPVHTHYRRVIDPYFSAERMAAFEPVCRGIAAELLDGLARGRDVEVMGEFAQIYALRAQAGFLDWPAEWHGALREWMRANHEATRSRDTRAAATVALAFDGHIRKVLAARRAGAAPRDDVTSRLLREQVEGRELADEEIVSILRNWTVGELGTIAASVGIILQFLARRHDVLGRLRARPELVPTAIDEILRIHPPLIASRRRTRCPVQVGGRSLPAGARLTVLWASANRDEKVFGDPDEFRLDRNPDQNLLYGRGVHVCPGAPLARLELRVLVEEMLQRRLLPVPAGSTPPVNAVFPAGGLATLHLRFEALAND